MDMDDISRDVAQRLAQLTSTAINIAQQIQHRRAASARQDATEQTQRRDEIADQLRAGHTTQAARWEQLRAHPDQPLSDHELATQWVSAASWEDRDSRAGQARRILDDRLAANGIPHEQLHQQRSDPGFTQAAEALNSETAPAHAEQTSASEREPESQPAPSSSDGHQFLDGFLQEAGLDEAQRRRVHADPSVQRAVSHIDAEESPPIRKAIALALTEAATDRLDAQAHDNTGPRESHAAPRQSASAGNVYANGAEPARLAGQSYPESASAALAKTGKKASPRTTRPSKQRDQDRSR